MAKKQAMLPGVSDDLDPELRAAAEALHTTRYERMTLQKREAEEEDVLIAAMKAKRVKTFRLPEAIPPFTVELVKRDPSERVKIREDARDESDEMVIADREARQDEPIGDDVMDEPPSDANRPLKTNRDKMAKAKAPKKTSGDAKKAARDRATVGD